MNNESRLTYICNAPPRKYTTKVRGKEYPAYRKVGKYKCDCGNIVLIRKDHVKSGNTKSCGCLNIETRSIRIRKDIHEKGLHKSGPRNPNKNHKSKRGKIAFYEDIATRRRVQKRSRTGNLYWSRTTKGCVYLTPEELDKKLNDLWSQEDVA